jgi:RNA polymerase sigma factor (sigma-70 family)
MERTPLHNAVRDLRALLVRGQLASLSDAELLDRFCRRGDDTAFALLVDRHGGMVWRVCRRILCHHQDAEDSYQATFMALAQHAAAIRRGQTVPCWLYRVAYRIARKAAMDRSKRHRHERALPRPCGTPEADDLSWRELQDVVQQELARLPEKYQAPFVLCSLGGKSKSEAAQQLNWKEGTVSSRLAYARKVLRQRLIRRGIAFGLVSATDLFLQCGSAPVALARATARAACWLRAGRNAKEFLSSQVIILMQGVGKTMFISHLMRSATLVMALCLIGTGGWAAAWSHRHSELPAQDTRGDLGQRLAENWGTDTTARAFPSQSPSAKPWIGFASRETNAGPELSIVSKTKRAETTRLPQTPSFYLTWLTNRWALTSRSQSILQIRTGS